MAVLDEEAEIFDLLNPKNASQTPETAAHWARFFFDALTHDWPGNTRELRHAVMLAAQDKSSMLPLTSQAQRGQRNTTLEELSDQHLEQVYRAKKL